MKPGPARLISVAATLLVVLAAPARAQWQHGYGSGEFYGGLPNCTVEFQGKIAIGGSFEGAGCEKSSGVILTDFERYYPMDDRLWRLAPGTARSVNSLVVYEGQLIAAGDFAGFSAFKKINNIARRDGEQWVALGAEPGDGSLYGGEVRDMVVFEGDLIAVGEFAYAEPARILNGIARWDGSQWQPMGIRPQGAWALEVWDGQLYCGFARWDGNAWVSFGTMLPAGSRVTALDVVDEGLAIGGTFEYVDGVLMDGATILDAQGLRQVVGGAFTTALPGLTETDWPGVHGFISFEGVTYMLAPRLEQYRGYFVLSRLTVRYDGGLYWNGVEALGSGYIWQLEGGSLLVTGDRMVAIAADSREKTDLEVAPMRTGAVLRGDEWVPLVPGLGTVAVPEAVSSAGDINWIAMGQQGLLAQSNRIARRVDRARNFWDLTSLEDGVLGVGSSVPPGDVAMIGGILAEYSETGEPVGVIDTTSGFGGNEFTEFRTAIPWSSGYLVAVEMPWGWTQVGPGLALVTALTPYEFSISLQIPVPEGQVDALVMHDGQPWYANSGQVYRIDGTPETGTTAVLVGTFNGPVNALLSDGPRLIVGGEFESVNTIVIRNLAAWDGAEWTEALSLVGTVNALARDRDEVIFVGGEFNRVNGLRTSNLAVFRGNEVGAFPDGPNGPVTDLALTERGLIVVGSFSSAGGYCSNNIAEWFGDGATVALMDAGRPGSTPRFTDLRLLAPSPNPFNPRVTLAFELPREGLVELRVYDLSGRLVKLIASEMKGPGVHEFIWDGTDANGRPVSSGVYLASLQADGRLETRKMALVR